MMFYQISTGIALLIAYVICFCCYPQTRRYINGEWETTAERCKLPLWAVILIFTIAVVPIVNLIASFIIIIVYSGSLWISNAENERIIVRFPSNRLTRLLNRRI